MERGEGGVSTPILEMVREENGSEEKEGKEEGGKDCAQLEVIASFSSREFVGKSLPPLLPIVSVQAEGEGSYYLVKATRVCPIPSLPFWVFLVD